MEPNQQKIYFIVNPVYDYALKSPFLEPFKDSKLDVLILSNNVDEILFQQNNEWKGKKLINVESAFDQISKDLGGKPEEEAAARNRIPEEDATSFCLWLKEELKDSIAKVTFSKRLTTTPAILTGQVSSSMQVMMKMMEQSGQAPDPAALAAASKESTLELNAANPLIVNLNQLRKTNKVAAKLVAEQLLDNVMVQSGIPCDLSKGTERQYKLLGSYLELLVNKDQPATRSLEEDESTTSGQSSGETKQSALKQARRGIKGDGEAKVLKGHRITKEDIKNASK